MRGHLSAVVPKGVPAHDSEGREELNSGGEAPKRGEVDKGERETLLSRIDLLCTGKYRECRWGC